MNSPKHLKHKPIISVNDYDKIDGKYAGHSDAKALSIGIAQYDEDEISAKIWRHTGKKWSRQSEEMPLHRVLDLAELIVNSLAVAKGISVSSNPSVSNNGDLNLIRGYYDENEIYLKKRLKGLKDALDGINLK
jgi:hypothetical protein